MSTTHPGGQPHPHQQRPPDMTPLEIARHRLHDLARGAHPELFDHASALHVAKRWQYIEDRYTALRAATDQLLTTLVDVDLHGPTPKLLPVARAIDLTAEELNQP